MQDEQGPPVVSVPTAPLSSPARTTLYWLRDLAVSVVIAIVVILFLYQPVKVEGTSMTPSLVNDERIFINKFVYRFGISDIDRGDTIVFWAPEDPSKSYIKRVIGVPGDVIEIVEGTGDPQWTAFNGTLHPRRGSRPDVHARPQGRRGALLCSGRPSQLLQRQPQLGHRAPRRHLRQGRVRVLAAGSGLGFSTKVRGVYRRPISHIARLRTALTTRHVTIGK